jgi:hypothetical protein
MEREITHNTKTNRFETIEEGITGYVEYERYDSGLDLTHTIVPKAIGGRGVAADLVKYALDYAAQNSLKVKPTCSYVKVYIDRHKAQYGHLEDIIETKFPTIEGGIGNACGIKK